MKAFKSLLFFITGILGAFLVWSVVKIFLPLTPPLIENKSASKNINYNINLSRLFFNSNPRQNIPQNIQTLKGVKLKAVFTSKDKNFIIIEKNNKTYFVNLNENFEGYKLIKINPQSAVFKRGEREYKISFEKIKNFYSPEQNIKTIPKSKIDKYKKNLTRVWKEIGIIKTPEGYKITYIKPNSVFEKLGLKKGDIILEINNMNLKSDADAWKAYNSLQDAKEIELLIKRNYNIKVLRYEID